MAEPADTKKQRLSRRVLVTIQRDPMTVTPRVVWQHELPILDHVFGEGMVKPVDTGTLDEGFSPRAAADLKPFNKTQEDFLPPSQMLNLGFVFLGDANTEFHRMISVYGRDREENISNAEKVFGRFSTGGFQSLLGTPTLDDLPAEQLRAMLREYGYMQQASYDADEDEKKAASAKSVALMKMPKDQLKKLAIEHGVNVH